MPLYEYECYVCQHRFERLQKVADAVIDQCPECGGKVRRLLGVPALQFKGSGWYVTDYGKGSSAASSSQTEPKNGSAAHHDSTSSGGSDTGKAAADKSSSKDSSAATS